MEGRRVVVCIPIGVNVAGRLLVDEDGVDECVAEGIDFVATICGTIHMCFIDGVYDIDRPRNSDIVAEPGCPCEVSAIDTAKGVEFFIFESECNGIGLGANAIYNAIGGIVVCSIR